MTNNPYQVQMHCVCAICCDCSKYSQPQQLKQPIALVLQEPRWVYDNPLTQAPPPTTTVAVSKGTLIQSVVGILNVLVTKISTLCTNGLVGQWTRGLHLISRMARLVGPTNANSVHRVWEDMLACLKAWAVPLSWPCCEDLQSQIWIHHKCNYVTVLST